MQFYLVALYICLLGLTGCGVKGNPLPPLQERQIGIGRHQYDKASKDIKEESETKKQTEADKKSEAPQKKRSQ